MNYDDQVKNKSLQEYMEEINEDDQILGGDYNLSHYDDDEGGLSQDEEY